ncbi:C-C motif chemokine 20-like [Protopterus annectens]|uniref:C-C motif chemokine 20-like n=1 Tax=Protopterus annectens TaxID=7888 RepID=UPI001CFB257F|nr:C-C motif chemokine 20-like [Protopterus annectens]
MDRYYKKTVPTAVVLLILINIFSRCLVTYAHDLDCCVSYSKKPLAIKYVRGFTEQRANEVCHVDAIIFHTKSHAVCADPNDVWVKRNLHYLSIKLQKMSERGHTTAELI